MKNRLFGIEILRCLFLLLLFQFAPVLSAQEGPIVVNLPDVKWGPPGGGNGVPLGTQTAQQRIDSDSGGVTYYARFPAGTHFDLHWHTHDEFVTVISGKTALRIGEETYQLEAGAYVSIPGGMIHSWDMPESDEVIILVSRAGPADRYYVDE
ncbi:MAG: cupin domain-containing protein [Gammaproteobacteria bacterium]|nr:cupin domain-containing protein [Pseudomonadales bacterium]MCP5347152.1 cupin domain-containing protein [Pseudomonadales bacterium]